MLRPLLGLAIACLFAGCLSNPAAHLERARELTFEHKPKEAIAEYDEALSILAKKDGEAVKAQRIQALKAAGDLCYLELKKYEKAAEYYRALADRYPEAEETLEARASLADIFRTRFRDRRAAVAELAAIVQTFPRSPEVDRFQYLAARDYFELGDFNQVMVETQLLQDRYPNSPYADDSQMLIAAAYAFQGQREKAVEAYELLVKRWPDGDLAPRALVEEAKLFSDAGEHEKAIEVLVRALKAHPDPKTLQSEIARLRKKLAQLRGPSHIPGAAIWTEGPELPTHAGLE